MDGREEQPRGRGRRRFLMMLGASSLALMSPIPLSSIQPTVVVDGWEYVGSSRFLVSVTTSTNAFAQAGGR